MKTQTQSDLEIVDFTSFRMEDSDPVPSRGRGRIIRISPELESYLRKRLKKKESFDSILRRLIGLNPRGKRGRAVRQREKFWLLRLPQPAIFPTEAEARGEAIIRAVRMKKKKTERPLELVAMD